MIHRIQENSFTSGGRARGWEGVEVDTITNVHL